MAPTMPQAGQDFQINSRLVPPNPSEAHTHHSNRGQTASLVICQRPQSICSSPSSVVASNQAVQRLTFLPQSSTSSWKVFFESLTTSSTAFDHSGHGPQSMLFSFSVTWALDYFAYIHIRTLWQCSIVKIYKNHRSLSRTALTATSTFFPCVNNFSNLKQCNWSQTICCPSGETWLVGKVGNPGNHFLRHTVGVQPDLPPPTLTYTKTQAHTFKRSMQLLWQVFQRSAC